MINEIFNGLIIAFIIYIIRYIYLRCFAQKHGRPELWYLPKYGFRLVIRNIPDQKVLSEIKSLSFIRKKITSGQGSSVSTNYDQIITSKEDFFLPPDNDYVLICFKLSKNLNDIKFIYTDKLGNKISEFSFDDFDEIISDYSAHIENYFNFNIKILKRVVIKRNELKDYFEIINKSNEEQKMTIESIINIGYKN